MRALAAALVFAAALGAASAEAFDMKASQWLEGYDRDGWPNLVATQYVAGWFDGFMADGLFTCPGSYRTAASMVADEARRRGDDQIEAVIQSVVFKSCAPRQRTAPTGSKERF